MMKARIFSPTTGGPTKVATPCVVQTCFKVGERERMQEIHLKRSINSKDSFRQADETRKEWEGLMGVIMVR